MRDRRVATLSAAVALSAALAGHEARGQRAATADLLIVNGNVYTLAWKEPAPDGTPASDAPRTAAGWKGNAEAVAIAGDRIVYVGSTRDGEPFKGSNTRVLDARGATVLPGLVDSHVHLANLGATIERVNLVDVATEEEVVRRVAERAREVPKGQWIEGYGWDEGAWASRYPDMRRLSEAVPDHPVFLRSLHSFAAWGNRLAFERAGITRDTADPEGGEIRKDAAGNPTGILLNRATALLERAVPAPSAAHLKKRLTSALQTLAAAGYVAVHEAGVGRAELQALQALEREGTLTLRVYAMLSARDVALCREWLRTGPDTDSGRRLTVRSVKAFYDGALGSRGALLVEDYTDRKGHRGLGGLQVGFDPDLMAAMMRAGFQASIHAIGDAGNRETLNFIEAVEKRDPLTRRLRHRIEHAQVVQPADLPRFASLDLIASMEPGHAVEDKAWAEARLGPERVKYAYAWRSIRRTGARMVFNSDLPGSDYNVFYGLHSAITRRGKDLQPGGGWFPAERMTPEEAVRGYTTWAAYTAFLEDRAGVLAPGRWADVTIMDVDPFALGHTDPSRLLQGKILWTIAGGRIAYERGSDE